MRCVLAGLLGLPWLMPVPASAHQLAQVQLTYDAYAAGLEIMQMHAYFGLGSWSYQIGVDYHTTGLVGLFYRGHQVNTVRGVWQQEHPQPVEFFGDGEWRGRPRRTLIDYDHDIPEIKVLKPPQETEREPVPAALRAHTMDTLSALAQLMRRVEADGRCETSVRTYDGRRVLEVTAQTGAREELAPSGRSMFHGQALRCDFEGRELAGFLLGEDDPEHRRPLRGSAWLAPVLHDAPPLPVRIAFQTRWFGWATMYLTGATDEAAEEARPGGG